MVVGTYVVYHLFWREMADITAPLGDKHVEPVKTVSPDEKEEVEEA
jgi:hypothetical protein